MDKSITISIKTVTYSAALFLALYLLYTIRPIILIVLVSLVIVVSIEHAVKFFQEITFFNQKLSRTTSVILSYFLFVSFVTLILTIGVPPVVAQAQKLFNNLSAMTLELTHSTALQDLGVTSSDIFPSFGNIFENLFSTTYSVFSTLAVTVSVIILAIYMSLDWINIKATFVELFSKSVRKRVQKSLDDIEISMGRWIKGEITLMLLIGVISFVGLSLIGIEYALALALVAGLLEIVPILGPVIATVLIGIVGFSESTTKGLAVVGFYILLQQLEGNVLVPKIMHRVSGFSPFIILIALMIGSTWAGAVGAIMAVPIMMMSVIVAKTIIKYSKEHQTAGN